MGTSGSIKPTRLLESHFASHTIRLIGQYVRVLDLSIEELAIVVLVFAESTRPIREDPYLAARFGHETRPLPNEYRPAVNLKYIHTSLGLSRETTRRKLEGLVGRGFLTKTRSGYVFHHPRSGNELSREFRAALAGFIEDVTVLVSQPLADVPQG